MVALIRAAFPDFQRTIDDQLNDGDSVITRSTDRGTHAGELLGLMAQIGAAPKAD